MTEEELVRESVNGATDYEPGERQRPSAFSYPYPTLNNAALVELPGFFVNFVEPQTEADPAALLLQFLTATGNAIGRTAYFEVEAAHHYGNIFTVAVGPTAAGRKGTAAAHVRRVLDESFQACIKSGLSSGEGVIHAVRDAVERREAVKQGGKATGEYQMIEVDAGVKDKRLLIYAPEFSQALKVTARDTNILSEVLRQAWDVGDLRILIRNSPEQATGAHISIIGHISKEELLGLLAESDCLNGFANRFLWYCARRSKELPDGGILDEAIFAEFKRSLAAAIERAQHLQRLHWSPDARVIWREVYSELSAPKPGVLGTVINRAEAQTVRLAVIYAALRGSPLISAEDLTAALAVWSYCEDSARFIFGDRLGRPVEDKILAALREKWHLTRTEITGLFSRNLSEQMITASLEYLQEEQLATKTCHSTGGRPVEVWQATRCKPSYTKETK